MIPPVFFFLVGLGLSYLVARRTSDSASWIAVGVSSAILAAFAALFSGDLYRAVGGRDLALVFLLAGFYRLMADGVAAMLAGGITGTLERDEFRLRRIQRFGSSWRIRLE
jgi:hypothetical protein